MNVQTATAVERERCARVADAVARHYAGPDGKRLRGGAGAWHAAAQYIAERIRSGGDPIIPITNPDTPEDG